MAHLVLQMSVTLNLIPHPLDCLTTGYGVRYDCTLSVPTPCSNARATFSCGLTPCCTNHRTIKAEHLRVQNKMMQGQSKFSGTCHHSLRILLVLWDMVWLCLYQRRVANISTAPLPEGRSRLVVLASPLHPQIQRNPV